MKKLFAVAIVALVSAFTASAFAGEVVVQMNLINEKGIGKTIGKVTLTDTPQGLRIAPSLSGLTPGVHGFHVHEKPDCGPGLKDGKPAAGNAAGGHYDPAGTGKHEGPHGQGHLGDLPPLSVDKDGNATADVTAQRLKVADVKGRSLMIHAGGDNFSDSPAPLGGGGGRVACGLIK
jgi:Cu-Zn family superoxide dismutase